MKKRTGITLAVLAALTCTVVFSACGHTHSYSDDWTSDETGHWHAATCYHDELPQIEKTEHTYDNGVVVKAATHTEDGEKKFTCTVCNYSYTEAIPMEGDNHTYSSKWSNDASKHWYAATCEHTDLKKEEGNHDWNVVVVAATHTTDGKKTYTCKVCEYSYSEKIDKLADAHTYESVWSKNETSHWHAATCGHDVKVKEAAHDWSEGIITKQPTHTEDGITTFVCTTCGYQKTETIEKLAEAHTYAKQWSMNETKHWHAANCGHDLKTDEADHDYKEEITKAATTTEKGVKTFTCKVCGYFYTEEIPMLETPHTHAWGAGEVTTPATCTEEGVRTYTCGCGETKTEDIPATGVHTWDEGVVTTPATCIEDGVKTYTCTSGGETKTRPIPAPGKHAWNEGEVTTAATCAEAGVMTYTCESCGETKTEAIKATGAHKWDEGVVTTDPTYDAQGKKLYTCEICRGTKTENVPMLEHILSDEWTYNEFGHWNADTPKCGHEVYANYAEHIYESYTDATCDVCGSVREVPLLVYDGAELEAALANLKKGATILLAGDEYIISGNDKLLITADNVTIMGITEDTTPTIYAGEYSVSGNAAFIVSGNNVTLSNFAIKTTASGISALKVTKIGETANVKNVTIKNVGLYSKSGHGLNLHGVDGATIDGLDVYEFAKCGISIARATDVTINNSSTHANGWADVGLMYDEKEGYETPSSVTIGNNNAFVLGFIYSERPSTAPGGVDTIVYDEDVWVKTTAENGTWTLKCPVIVMNEEGLRIAISRATDGEVITIGADITLTSNLSRNGLKNITFKGTEQSVVFNKDVYTITFNGANVTFENLTLKANPVEAAKGNNPGEYWYYLFNVQHAVDMTYTNCIVEDGIISYNSGVSNFNGCTFISNYKYSLWYYGGTEFNVTDCTFISESENGSYALKIYSENKNLIGTANIKNSTFTSNVDANKAAIEIDGTYSTYTVNIDGKTAQTGFNGLVNNNKATVNIDDNQFIADGFYKDANGIYVITSTEGMYSFAATVKAGQTYAGKTVMLTTDVTLEGEWEPINNFKGTFDGGNYVIYGLEINMPEAGSVGLFGSSISALFKNIVIDGAKITGGHYVGAIVGYAYASVEGCKVINSELTAAPYLVNGEYDNGDKVGGIVGYLCANAYVKNCTVENTIITAYRDLGGIVGCAMSSDGKTPEISGNTVDKVTLIQSNENEYGKTELNVGAVVGRVGIQNAKHSYPVVENNTVYAITFNVASDVALNAALMTDAREIEVILADDLSFNVSDAYLLLGGESTTVITIDGNNENMLTLATSYWSRLDLVNPDATLVLNNLTVTSSQATGTWDSYDVTFNCNVEMNNVVFNKAVALDNPGKTSNLNNVTIKETHDYYALWIVAGGNVTIDGLTVESAGRGIKIDEQYLNDVQLTTLDVKNATFKTAKKGAILVETSAGAKITLENIDITNVAADKVNAVWIDADATAYVDLVEVIGGTVFVEGGGEVVVTVSVELDKQTATVYTGDTLTLVATVKPATLSASDKEVIWSSSDPTVATVENGVVNALKEGTTVITATSKKDSTKKATCTVTVEAKAEPNPEKTPLATLKNDANQMLRYKDNYATLELDREQQGGTAFTENTDYVKFYVYTSANAAKDAYVGSFNLIFDSSFKLVAGDVTITLNSGAGNIWIMGLSKDSLFDLFEAAVGENYSATQTYYIAAQAVAYADSDYTNSEISAIGPMLFREDNKLASPTLAVDADGKVTITDTNTEGVASYVIGFFAAGSNEPTATVAAVSGEALDDTKVLNGTYTLKVKAVAITGFTDSDWSTGVEYVVNNASTEKTPLATLKNEASEMFKFNNDYKVIELDRNQEGGTAFTENTDYIMFYVYTSTDAAKDAYVGTFKLVNENGFKLVAGDVTFNLIGNAGNLYANDAATTPTNLFNIIKAAVGEGYSTSQAYYFAAQAIAKEGTVYTDSEISTIGPAAYKEDILLALPTLAVTAVALEIIDGKAYIVYSGTFANYTVEEVKTYGLRLDDAQNHFTNFTPEWTVNEADGTFTAKCDISNLEIHDFYYMHGGFNNNFGDIKTTNAAIAEGKGTVIVGKKAYILDEQYGTLGVRVRSSIIYTGVDIEVDGNKLFLVLTGTYSGYTAEELEAFVVKGNFQENPYMASNCLSWDGSWGYPLVFSGKTALDAFENGTFELKIDITELAAANDYAYTGHLSIGTEADIGNMAENAEVANGGPADFKLAVEVNKTIEFNGKSVTLINVPNGGNENYFGCVGIKTSTLPTPNPEPETDYTGWTKISDKASLENALKGGNENKNMYLECNIDLGGATISSTLGAYSGTFDGRGYSISNFACANLFGGVTQDGVIKNLAITCNASTLGGNMGLFGLEMLGTVENCYIDITFGATPWQTVMGRNGKTTSKVINTIILVRNPKNTQNVYAGFGQGAAGTWTNTFYASLEGTVGANGPVSKTEAQLKEASLYANFDEAIWRIEDGMIPVLINANAEPNPNPNPEPEPEPNPNPNPEPEPEPEPEPDPYPETDYIGYTKISSKEELKAVSTGGNYYLACDIDFAGEVFTEPFISTMNGVTLDGKGYALKNIKTNFSANETGFINMTDGSTTIKNVNFINFEIGGTNTFKYGGLICHMDGNSSLKNCYFEGTITARGDGNDVARIGVIGIKFGGGTIENCIFNVNFGTAALNSTSEAGRNPRVMIARWINGDIKNCIVYKDALNGAAVYAVGNGDNGGEKYAEAFKTEEDLKKTSTYDSTWTVWVIKEGELPRLKTVND